MHTARALGTGGRPPSLELQCRQAPSARRSALTGRTSILAKPSSSPEARSLRTPWTAHLYSSLGQQTIGTGSGPRSRFLGYQEGNTRCIPSPQNLQQPHQPTTLQDQLKCHLLGETLSSSRPISQSS